MTRADVLTLIRREIDRAGSLRALAREWKVSAAYLSDVMNTRRHPGKAILVPLRLTVKRTVRTTYAYSRR